MEKEKKITRATVRAFIRRAGDRLEIRRFSEFDPMTDGPSAVADRNWKKAQPTPQFPKHTEGIDGAWFVGCT